MTEEQTAEIFAFIQSVTPYLDDMAARGDHKAMHLHVAAVGILAEHGEEPHEPPCPAADGFGCRCGEGAQHD